MFSKYLVVAGFENSIRNNYEIVADFDTREKAEEYVENWIRDLESEKCGDEVIDEDWKIDEGTVPVIVEKADKSFTKVLDKVLNKMYDEYESRAEMDCEDTEVPYGDGYVSAGSCPTEESVERCLERFKEDKDGQDIAEELLEDDEFLELLEKHLHKFR